MRRLRYSVAVSADGFIAGPNGEYDWIVMDPAIDFAEIYSRFATVVMGRKTFEVVIGQGQDGTMPGMDVVVFSRTLSGADYPGVTIVSEGVEETVRALKEKPGKDIWLFGGGELFRALLDAELVDTIEIGVMPVLLSQGIQLLPAGRPTPRLRLTDCKTLPASGIVLLSYAIDRAV